MNFNNAFTAEDTATAVKVEPAKEEKKVDADDLSSKENRANLKYQLTIGFLGAEYSSDHPITLSAGYFVNPKSIISLRYSNINSSDGYQIEKMRAVTLGYRHFLGNSFNIMPTAYWRRTNLDDHNPNLSWLFGTRHFIYEDVGVGIRLGNEWQWENFTMGCDWIGVNRAVKVLNKDDQSTSIFDDGDTKESMNVTLLSFYLGYSF